MDTQDTQDFNQRLSQWVASQGFWFQLRHSMSGGGSGSVLMFHLLRLAATVGVFLLVVAGGFAIYLVQRVESREFRDQVETGIGSALSADEVVVRRFGRSRGQAQVGRIGMTGSDSSFFDSLEASNLRFEMGLTDGLIGDWDAGTVEASWLDAELKAGANSPEDAAENAGFLLEGHPGFRIQGLTVNTVNLSWGYFDRAYGAITGSEMRMGKTGDGWRMRFEGGTFSQNWLRGFEIEELIVVFNRDGVAFEKGILRAGKGSLTFRDVRLAGGVKPQLSGSLLFKRVPLERLLPDDAEEMISGTISGEVALGGSTNSREGVTMAGQMVLDGVDQITLRSSLPLLDALDVVDAFHSYRRIDFDQGGFTLETGGGKMKLSDISLTADELMKLNGTIVARTPEESEIESLLGQSDASLGAAIRESQQEELQISLRQAARLNDDGEEDDAGEQGLGGEVEDGGEEFFKDIGGSRDLRRDFMERARSVYEFSGELVLSLPPGAFDRSSRLSERFPVDPQSGRTEVEVPLSGTWEELTSDFAEELLRIGVRD